MKSTVYTSEEAAKSPFGVDSDLWREFPNGGSSFKVQQGCTLTSTAPKPMDMWSFQGMSRRPLTDEQRAQEKLGKSNLSFLYAIERTVGLRNGERPKIL